MPIRAADLLPKDHFQIPFDAHVTNRGRKGHVVEIGPSRMQEGHVRVVITSTRGTRAILVLPDDLMVTLLSRAAPSPVKAEKCRCKNHLGKQKIAYKSREDAAAGILHRHIHHGEHRIYPCPTQEGRFHVASKKARVHRPKG